MKNGTQWNVVLKLRFLEVPFSKKNIRKNTLIR